MRTVRVCHDYPASPERLWSLATDYGALQKIMQGIVTFEGLPAGRTETGQQFELEVSLFGVLPKQPYHIEVVECDDELRVLRSFEHGAGVKRWAHSLCVVETAKGSRLIDEIEIDAGFLTPLFCLWAKFLYKKRHKPRLEMLEAGMF